jgi:thiol-disulfide isomerase/thioredoxin
MSAKSKTLIGLILFAIILVIAMTAYSRLSATYKPDNNASGENTSQGNVKKIAAPDFTVTDAQGNEVSLSDFKGKPVVLNFWASWCPPCKSEMPHFNAKYGEVKDDIVFMMVDLVDGQRETQAKGQKYVDDNGFTFPVYFDNQQEAASKYGISSIPTSLFIDKNGDIVAGYQGAIDEKTLAAAIEKIR